LITVSDELKEQGCLIAPGDFAFDCLTQKIDKRAYRLPFKIALQKNTLQE
jgi:hypothetical protein